MDFDQQEWSWFPKYIEIFVDSILENINFQTLYFPPFLATKIVQSSCQLSLCGNDILAIKTKEPHRARGTLLYIIHLHLERVLWERKSRPNYRRVSRKLHTGPRTYMTVYRPRKDLKTGCIDELEGASIEVSTTLLNGTSLPGTPQTVPRPSQLSRWRLHCDASIIWSSFYCRG